MADYKLGQILVANQDIEVELPLSGKKEIIKKGSKAIVGFDKRLHHYNGKIQCFADDIEIDGMCGNGLAEFIFDILKAKFPMKEMMEGYDVTDDEIMEELIYALDEIGIEEGIE